MSQASDYCENALANSLFGKTSDFGVLASAPTLYIALCTAAPVDSDTGSTITEAAYTSYARVSTSPSDWNTSSGGSIDNANAITFPQATGGSETETHFAIVDAASGGNMICYGTLGVAIPVVSGSTPKFEAGNLTVTVS